MDRRPDRRGRRGLSQPAALARGLRYQYPLTAVVDDVRLVADDPAKPGATVDIFVAKHVTLEMAEIPRPGQPLRIQRLILDHPEFRAVSVSEKDSSLVGYSNLLKSRHRPARGETQRRFRDPPDPGH